MELNHQPPPQRPSAALYPLSYGFMADRGGYPSTPVLSLIRHLLINTVGVS